MIFLKEKSRKNWKVISEESDIPMRTIESLYLKYRTNPHIETVMKIAEYFNVSLDDLVYKDLSKKCE